MKHNGGVVVKCDLWHVHKDYISKLNRRADNNNVGNNI